MNNRLVKIAYTIDIKINTASSVNSILPILVPKTISKKKSTIISTMKPIRNHHPHTNKYN